MPASAPPQNKPGALAVLAEIDLIEPELKRHRQEFTPAFSASISGMFPAIFSQLGIKSPPSPQISQSLVTKTVSQSLENIGKVQSAPQLQQLVADAATQSIIDQKEIAKGKTAEQIYEKAQTPASQVVQANQKGLEEEAVLAGIAQIASLEKPDQETRTLIADEIQSQVESQDPLMPPDERDKLFASITSYLEKSRENLNIELTKFAEESLPSLEEFQEIKNKAHDQTISQLGDAKIGNIDLKELTLDIGAEQGTKPLNPGQADRFGFGSAEPTINTFRTRGLAGRRMGIVLATNKSAQEKAILALATHDIQKMAEVSRDPRLMEFGFFKKAKDFSSKKSKEVAKYVNHFQEFPGGLNRASQTTWRSIFTYLNRYPGIFVPQSILNNRVLVYGSIGALSHGSGSFSLGNVVSGARGLTSGLKSAIGFGQSAKGALAAGKLALGASNPAGWALLAAQLLPFLKKHAAKIIAGTIGLGIALWLLLAKLLAKLAAVAAGAATGAVIGFVVGGPAGAVIGAFIGAGAGYFIVPITKSISGFVGGASGGIGSLTSAFSSFLAAASSAVWNTIASFGSGLIGGLGAGAGFLMNAIGSLSVPGGAVLASVIIAPTAVFVTTVALGIFTGAAFMSTEADLSATRAGDNEFYAITKSPSSTSFPNPPPDQTVLFTITVTSKKLRLTDVQVKDEAKVQGKSNSFSRSLQVNNCQGLIEGGATCTQQTALSIDSSFADSVISNTVTVTATPEGQAAKTDSVTVVVIVGNPPAECPRGWPLVGRITQGPEGASSHTKRVYGGYEAIDIGTGVVGTTDVYATVEGTVENVWPEKGDPLDRRIMIKTAGCPGLITVNYWHLSQTLVQKGEFIKYGQKLGKSGRSGSGPHSHYQFNEVGDRSFKMDTPYIPKTVPRSCDSEFQCNITIDSPL
ncbi:M23 family metallopeptidase [Candidatus Curtissbacteria bacterium]|nr:M23 family metallopeptidase [Candidatus Curtissbacteria bacterium]